MHRLCYSSHILIIGLLLSLTIYQYMYSQDWPHFWPARFDFPVGDNPLCVATGDFDKDGVEDLAVANCNYWTGSHGNVSILMGRGNGSFDEPIFYEVGESPSSIATGDFDRDGNEDLAVTDVDRNDVAILMGKGDGLFGEPTFYEAGERPGSIAIGDFDGDEIEDLAVTNDDDVTILMGQGDGSFGAPSFFQAGADPGFVAIGEFNGDGHEDLAVANWSSENVAILLGNGDGSFGNASFYISGDNPNSVAIGDFDSDGNEDLAVTNFGDGFEEGSVTILLGLGDGSFWVVQTIFVFGNQSGPVSVAIGDFNEDGHEDLAVAYYEFWRVVILEGTGTGTFDADSVGVYRTSWGPTSAAIGDFDGDGHEDLAVTSETGDEICIFLGAGDGSFGEAPYYEAGCNPESVAIGDFDNDSYADMAAANRDDDNVAVFMGAGDGTFEEASFYQADDGANSVAIGDFDGDGLDDMAVANLYGDNVAVFRGLISSTVGMTFGEASFFNVGDHPWPVAAGDFNGDGFDDLVTANSYSNDVAVLLAVGDGSFHPATFYATGESPLSVAISDFDGDGNADLAVANYIGDNLCILLGHGDGTFGEASYYGTLDGPHFVAVGDFNDDSHNDLAVANAWNDNVAVLMGNGDGTFGEATFYGVKIYPVSIGLGDFNADGCADLAVAHLGAGIAILLGNGDGTFEESAFYGASTPTMYVTTGDFDEDGHDDLAVVNEADGDISIFLGNWKEVDVEVDCDLDSVPQGSNLLFAVGISNKTDSTVTFEVTVSVKRVGGSEIPFFGPLELTLLVGKEIARTPSIDVPAKALPGDYILIFEAKSFVGEMIDEDSFRVTVVESSGSGASHPEGFLLKGW